jgi:uncharacterized protein (DUF488 family)
MLLQRQRYLLSLLFAAGGSVKNLDFQKLLFLSCQELDLPPFYEFIPYHLGAFSFTSYYDRRHLTDEGLLEIDEYNWRLTPSGRKTINNSPSAVFHILNVFMTKYCDLRGDDLVAYTYRTYPYYGIRSDIAQKVLHSDPIALRKIEEAKPLHGTPGLLTIGYEGLSLEAYLNLLINTGVTILCDVRRNPLSRKYGFSKNTLSKACSGVGIKYEHLPELGIESDQRKDLVSQSDYDRLFKEYEKNCLPLQGESIEKICEWIRSGQKVALTCYEHSPVQCHRHCVAEAVEIRLGRKIKANNL